MYTPKPFEVTNTKQIMDLIRSNSFGILFTQNDGVSNASHLPFLIEESENGECYLLGHMAKANSQWSEALNEVLVVFQGPHAYISPTWYQAENTVPTWNYAAVHVYGELIVIDNKEELISLIAKTVNYYESAMETPWETSLITEFNDKLLTMIVGFKIKVKRFTGKWKLNQNHSVEIRQKVINALRKNGDENSNGIASLMEASLFEQLK
jgi:transcriptional regulator